MKQISIFIFGPKWTYKLKAKRSKSEHSTAKNVSARIHSRNDKALTKAFLVLVTKRGASRVLVLVSVPARVTLRWFRNECVHVHRISFNNQPNMLWNETWRSEIFYDVPFWFEFQAFSDPAWPLCYWYTQTYKRPYTTQHNTCTLHHTIVCIHNKAFVYAIRSYFLCLLLFTIVFQHIWLFTVVSHWQMCVHFVYLYIVVPVSLSVV